VFAPLLSPPGPPERPALIISVRGGSVALSEAGAGFDEVETEALFVGTIDGQHCWAVDLDLEPLGFDPPETFTNLMSLFGGVGEPTWIAAGRAVQLVEWARCHRYCGRCGNPTDESPGERARRCPQCGLLAFPRLAPAVITLVERDDGRALLARNARWTTGMYSCLAGFVEPGETLEEAVRREIQEEVGIDVDRLSYRRSQPWPFPHSLMLGFNARYAGGDLVCDGTEIAEARWFAPDDLPDLPGPISIARWLIDDWLSRAR
jgi:NAD+ diphosphatase